MADLTLRRYEPGDEPAVIDLWNALFPTPTTRAHRAWKFTRNPEGPAAMAVACHGGRVVGHLGFNPVRVLVDGRVVRAGQAVDAMVDTRTWGLAAGLVMTRLWRFLESSLTDSERLAFVFGFPTAQFQPLTERILSGHDVGPVSQVAKVLDPGYALWHLLRGRPGWQARLRRLVARRGTPSPGRPPTDRGQPSVTRLREFDGRFDRLWEDIAPGLGAAVVRDRRYLDWRYADPAYVVYAITEPARAHGAIVLRTLPWEGWRVGHVADLWARDEETARRLVRAAVTHFRQERVGVIRGWLLEHSPLYPALRGAGFRPRPALYRLMIRELPRVWAWPFLQERRHWHLALGDSDGI